MKVYVDDMIVKSMQVKSHLSDLRECFEPLRGHNMKLNPEKCTFALGAGKFLGFLVSHRGIEANVEKIQAIIDMHPPKIIRDIQRLNGRLAALRRFISKLTERCLPFFDTLKGAVTTKMIKWTPECQFAFEDLKTYLSSPPLLATTSLTKPLSLYLSASHAAVGAVLVKENDGDQKPVHYVSHVLKDVETRYSPVEKFAYALITASRKIRHYFQARNIKVIMNQPLKKLLHKPDLSGRLINWAVELSQFSITYELRNAIKAQTLSDCVIECSFNNKEIGINKEPTTSATKASFPESWKLFIDGSSTTSRSRAGLILISPEGFRITQAIHFAFKATNNQAEYEALIAGIHLAKSLQVEHISVFSESQIVVRQVKGDYTTKDATLMNYLTLVKSFMSSFTSIEIIQINREDNTIADCLSKLVESEKEALNGSVYFEELKISAFEGHQIIEVDNGDPNWMNPIIDYLKGDILPANPIKAKRIRAQSAKYFIENDILYKQTFDSPILKCINPEEALYCMIEVNEGIYGDHMGGKTLAQEILREGYFWSTMAKDFKEFVKKCFNTTP